MSYIDIQNEVVKKYRIDLCNGTKCDDGDWDRTHSHVKIRRVCKWKQKNSIQSTFTLFHEIGHIETTKSYMRRAESEYYATLWAMRCCEEYSLNVPDSIIKEYQDYIDMEIARGKRRGGLGYGELKLVKSKKSDIKRTTRIHLIEELERIKKLIAEQAPEDMGDYAIEHSYYSIESAIEFIKENFED